MSAIPADLPQAAPTWRRSLLGLAIVLLVLLLLYHETATLMVATWERSDTFAHAFLVPPIAGWLIWRRRAALAALQPCAEPWVLPLMGVAAVAWLLGALVDVNAVTQFALVALIVLSVPAVLGRRVAREILFPLVFLFFCVPVGEFLLPVLMEATADFTVGALQLTGVPVYREGQQFIIPSGHWSVIEACSGVRYLIASFMVGTLFGYLNFRSIRKRVLFGIVSLIVPIIANWLRAYMIVMIGHLSNNRLAVGVDHIVYGWVFFGIVISAMFFIGMRWSEPERPADNTPALPSAAQRGATGGAAALVVIAALVILLLPQAVLQRMDHQDAAAATPVLVLPTQMQGGALAVQSPAADWKPRYVGMAAETNRSYAFAGHTVGVHIAYYRAQTFANKLIGSENVLVMSRDPQWNRLSTVPHEVSFDGRRLTMLRSDLVDASAIGQPIRHELTVLHLYWVNGHFTANEYWAKVQGAIERLAGRGDDGAAVFFYTTGDPKTIGGPTLDAFAAANLGAISDLLHKTRDVR